MAEYLLEIIEGPDAGRQFALDAQTSEIGRDSGVAVELVNDHLVSRRHARLTLRDDGIQVEDLGSRNGTFVNGNQIYAPAIVTPGNEITIGVSVLALRPVAGATVAATRVVPAALTMVETPRRAAAPEAPPALTPVAVVPQPAHEPPFAGLAQQERPPDYVPRDVHAAAESPLSPLLDRQTKRMARTAPLAIFVIVVLVVIVALALR